MAITSISQAETINSNGVIIDGKVDGNALQAQDVQWGAQAHQPGRGKPESQLRAAARRHGFTLTELADRMGVSKGHLCSVANGHRPWTPNLRERVTAVLGEVPGQGVVYRQGGPVTSESTYIRERAREQGMTLKDLAVAVGVSYRYMTQAARGQRDMSPRVQARVESALGGPAEIAPARCANRRHGPVKGETTFIRERAREMGMSMRELAEKVGVSMAAG